MFATNVNQAAAALYSGAPPPVWLTEAVGRPPRAVARVDAATGARGSAPVAINGAKVSGKRNGR